MKRGRTLLLLTLVLGLVVAGYFGARFLTLRAENKAEAETLDPLWTVQSAISRISFTHQTELTLELTDDTWHCTLDPDAVLDSSILANILRQLQQITPIRELDTKERELYGLNAPVLTVSFLTEGGEHHTLSFGTRNTSDGYVYAETEDGDCVYTISADVFDAFPEDFLSLIQKDSMPAVEVSALQTLTVCRDSLTLEVGYDADGKETAYCGNFTWFIGEPFADWREADTEAARDLFYNISRLYLYECAWYDPDESTWVDCGLTAPMATVTMEYTDEAGDTQSAVLEIGGESYDGRTYVRINHGNMILTANTVQCKTIAYASANALLPTAVCLLTEDMVDSLTVLRNHTATRFTLEHSGDIITCKKDAKPYDAEAMADFFYRLQEITQAESVMDAETDTLDDSAYTLTFRTSREGFETQVLRLYPYETDGEAHYLVQFGNRCDQIIECAETDALIERLLAGEVSEIMPDD